MSKLPRRLQAQSHLRVDAEARLRHGITPPSNGWTVDAEALALLFRLASDPDRAADALKLLHELQVHQVELDLQLNQLESTEREIPDELTRYQMFFQFAPVGYLVLGYDGRIIESNVLGYKLLGVKRDELGGRFADSFLAPESRSTFIRLLKNLRDGDSGGACKVQSNNCTDSRQLQCTATMMPGGETILLAVAELPEC